MRKALKKLLILFFIINFMGLILEGAVTVDNSKATIANENKDKNGLKKLKEKGKITVVAPLKDISYFYLDTETNTIEGIDADIIAEIMKRLGINIMEIKETLFADLFKKLSTDDSIDMAAGGIYITPEREELVSFTQPLYKGTDTVVVPLLSNINFKSDLKNAVVGVVKGTVFVELAERWKENKLIKDMMIFETTADALNAINSAKVDAGLVDSIIVKYSLKKEKNLSLRVLKDYTPEVYGNVGIPVGKNDNSLLNELNKIINDMKADGTLYGILIDNGLDKSNMV